ncbi:hypothetical protein FSW04_25085 [Baekduia soli]|uniref:Carotenoid 1,2-hydratase n=1 Tax=Baekduia soli TaxID=496014 RepID=A0A5B8UC19_9ACTN|nr:hypothetical protein [Baekduia soli]QEC50534.1 hypothetical protein FSW04_25085 [Baekduia soli]
MVGPPDGELGLSAVDDYPFHQAPAPLPVPATSDPRFNDGYYFGFFAPGRFAYLGLRLYANMNVMDGYAGAIAGGEQRTVRASRALRPSVDVLEVGPVSMEILEPMRRQRLRLAENATGVTFDVEVTASSPAFFEAPDIHHRQGRLINHVLRYTQLSRVSGVMAVDGEEIAVDAWYGDRDHSWGIRHSMGPAIPVKGVERSAGDPRAMRIWIPFEVGDHRGMFAMHEDADGRVLDFDGRLLTADGTEIPLTGARHAFRYVPGTRRLTGGSFTLTDVAGGEHAYAFEVVADPACAQGFGYVRGWQDGLPPGSWRGAEHVEADRFRVDDPAVVAGPAHVPVERRLGVCEYPSAIEGPGGQRGMAQIEHMIYRPYRPYGLS